jgi:hypothetical protein
LIRFVKKAQRGGSERLTHQRVGGGMEPVSPAEQRGTWMLQIRCHPTIWKHGSFPVWLNDHDD